MADIKWIKIDTNIFDDEKIKLIEALPSADSIIVIWFKLLCLAGQANNSGVFMLTDKIAYTDEMLAAIFRRDVSTVRLAISTFQQYGMIEVIDDVLTIPNWSKHQSLDAYERKKERDRLYQRERREKQRQMVEDKKSSDNRMTVGRKCSYSYSSSLYINNNKDIKNDELTTTINPNNINYNDNKIEDDKSDLETIKEIVSYLNKTCNTRYRHNTPKTKELIRARLREKFTIDDFKTVIDKKYRQWGNDTKMSQFLRPQTLFGTKFEAYLNQKVAQEFNIDDWGNE